MDQATVIAIINQLELFLDYLKAELGKTAAAAPAPVQPKIVVPPGAISGGMSIFGLDWDGSDDEGDEAPDGSPLKGAWGDETHNKTAMGCALPIKVLKATFGSTAKPKTYAVYIFSLTTQKLVKAQFLDKGPAARVHRPIDGTYAVHKELGHLDYGIIKYGSFAQFPATFPVIFWLEDLQGQNKQIKGWDAVTSQVE